MIKVILEQSKEILRWFETFFLIHQQGMMMGTTFVTFIGINFFAAKSGNHPFVSRNFMTKYPLNELPRNLQYAKITVAENKMDHFRNQQDMDQFVAEQFPELWELEQKRNSSLRTDNDYDNKVPVPPPADTGIPRSDLAKKNKK